MAVTLVTTRLHTPPVRPELVSRPRLLGRLDQGLHRKPAIHAAVIFLVEHLPPNLHVVVATRADPPLPLPRLSARGHLAELRQEDLRFTAEEAAAFLKHVMGLGLSAADVAALGARTEGWIAGLQMAALSLQGHGPQPAGRGAGPSRAGRPADDQPRL